MRPSKTIFKDKSKTQRHMADAVDLNKMVAKAGLGNVQVQDRPLQYLDISGVQTFHQMQNHIAKVDQGFMKMDPKIRGFFKNKSANMAEFMVDPKNHPRAWAMGLMDDPDGLLEDAWEKLHPTKKDESPPPVDESAKKDEKEKTSKND